MYTRKHVAGQGTLEYVLILAVVILAIIAAASGPFRGAIDRMFQDSSRSIENASSRLGH